MSEASGSPSQEEKPVSSVKKSIAARLTEGRMELPEDVKDKITEIAGKLGKKEVEVYQEIVAKGLASTSEDLAYQLARRKVIDSLTPSEHVTVLKNVENYMKQVQSIFGTWKETPTPVTVSQPTETQPVSQTATQQVTSPQSQNPLISQQALDKSTKEILKTLGLPEITLPQAQGGETASLTQGSLMTLLVAKMAIDKLGGTAITALMNNSKVQEAIANLINKIANDPQLQGTLSGLLGELTKLMGGGQNPPT